MRARFVPVWLLLATVVALGGGHARADMISFEYSWSVEPDTVPSGTGSVSFAVAKTNPPLEAELGSATKVNLDGPKITTTSSAGEKPDSFDTAFKATLHIKDAQGEGDLTFTGSLKGELTATSSTLKSKIEGDATKELTIGGHIYSVTIAPVLIDLPKPGANADVLDRASLNGLLTVRSVPVGGVQNTPEPSSLLLGATALLGVAGPWLRARRLLRARKE